MIERACIYTIPAGQSFVDCLARGILEESGGAPETLAAMQILLPTRRAARALRDAFLRVRGGAPLLLPRLSPIGDVDEEELSLLLTGTEEEFTLPPAISATRRQLILAKMVAAQGRGLGFEQDMALAAALGRLMDQIYTEDLDLKNLPAAVDREDFAAHWKVSITFLSILSEAWPKILLERGMIDAADRRNRLIKSLSAHWEKTRPQTRIIAAGSTGSIPATARLLKTIAHLPNGCIVLPGLDQVMDAESWAQMDDTHPQATLRNLLAELGTDRKNVELYPAAIEQAGKAQRMRSFVTEMMRPAPTSGAWQDAGARLSLTREDLPVERYECDNAQEEALTIAAVMRSVLEDETKTAALITPDRKLARRVAMACRRWGIEIDDSAGLPLSETTTGLYLRLGLRAVFSDLRPVPLLDFCKHARCAPKEEPRWRALVRRADEKLLRGPAFRTGLAALRTKITEREDARKDVRDLERFVNILEEGFAPLIALQQDAEKKPFLAWLDAHLHAAEFFADADILWTGKDGEAAAGLLAALRDDAEDVLDLSGADYAALLKNALGALSVRPDYGRHARLAILGQLEARMVAADVTILGGLNEGTWPPAAPIDPWMSRPMRRRFKLPSPERSIGLAAHDFAQGLCAPRVILTRAKKIDGTPTVPARWLQRMDTVLEACGLKNAIDDGDMLRLARLLDYTPDYTPVQRPEPRPPLAARPREISVTRVETWMNDPYSIYARYILGLYPLKPLEQDLDNAMRGTLVHGLLDRFVAAFPDDITPDAEKTFLSIAREELDRLAPDASIRTLWEPRLSRIGDWLIETERGWREIMKPAARETEGRLTLSGPQGPFVLKGIADRIDVTRDGRAGAVIDYKSAGNFAKKGMISGKHPQLALEALILTQGGFETVGAKDLAALSYWIVKGGRGGGEIVSLSDPKELTTALEAAQNGLQALIDAFDDESTPYYSLPRPDRAPRYNDYEHLARLREWTAPDEAEEADAA